MRWLAWIAVVVLAIAGAFFGSGLVAEPAPSKPPQAVGAGDLVYRSGSFSVRLTDAKCDHEELETAVLIDGGFGDVKAAVVTMGTTVRAACWAMNGGGSVVARDYRATDRGQSEDVIPLDWFKRGPA